MRRIVIATDGSKYAEEGAWFLSHLPHDEKLDLTVVTVLQLPTINAKGTSADWIAQTVQRERDSAKQAYERIAAMFEGANVEIRHEMREGHRGQSIIQCADEHQADLIVIGARGQSTVRRLLLGSTSDYVATHAPCSVLVVRPTGLREEKRPVRIAIGYTQADAADAALEEFAETKWGEQSEVHVVSVVSYVSAFLNEIVVDSGESREIAKRALDQATEKIQRVAPHVNGHLIEKDHIGEGLVEFAEEHKIDLLVVGETHHSVLSRMLLGSVSRFVLRHAPCSVWITRNWSKRQNADRESSEHQTSRTPQSSSSST